MRLPSRSSDSEIMGKARTGRRRRTGRAARNVRNDQVPASIPHKASSKRTEDYSPGYSQPPCKKPKLAAKAPRTSFAEKSHVPPKPRKAPRRPQQNEDVGVQLGGRSGLDVPVTENLSKPGEGTGTGEGAHLKTGKKKIRLLTVSRTSLHVSSIFGTDVTKERAWKRFLQDAEDIVKHADELGAAAKKKASRTIKCLETKEKAAQAGKVALRNFEYFDEDRIRTLICIGFEDSIPGEWKCGWSSQRVRKVAQLLSLFTTRISRTHSKILKEFPLFVVAGVLNVIFTCENGDSVAEWGENKFHATIWETVDAGLYACYRETERTDVDLTVVKNSINLMVLLCKKIAPLFKKRDISYEKDVLREVSDTLNARHDVDLLWNHDEINKIMNNLATVSPTLYDELLPQIWDKYQEKRPKEFTLTTLVFETLYLVKDIYSPILLWQHKDWNSSFQELMFELGGEEDNGYAVLDFTKVFTLTHVLHGGGLRVENLDTEVLAQQLVGRINVKGEFTERRVREELPGRYRRRLAVDRKQGARRGPGKVGRFAAE